MKTKTGIGIILLLILSLLTGCAKTTGKIAATPIVDSTTFKPAVNATGMVVPARWAVLSAQTSGVVGEVLVADGDQVEAGQSLIQLTGAEAANAVVTAAKLELTDAQSAYDALENNSAAKAAQALKGIVTANEMIIAAERALDDFDQNPYLNKVKQAQADVNREKAQLDLAKKDFDKYATRPETDSTRKYYADRLADQQRDYDAAVRDLHELEVQKQQAEASLATGQAMLVTAQKDYDERKDGPSEADRLFAEARLENANAKLKSAVTALAQLSLPAPFDGVVHNPKARVGELVSAGQPLMYLSDPSTMQVETTDLNEIDVARLHIGDAAVITFDALPDVILSGKVSHIATRVAESAGVNYTVVIMLDEIPARLLWGMTAYAEISVEE